MHLCVERRKPGLDPHSSASKISARLTRRPGRQRWQPAALAASHCRARLAAQDAALDEEGLLYGPGTV